MKNRIQLFFIFILLIASDQFLKFLFSENSVCNKNLAWSIPLAPGFFYFFWIIIIVCLAFLFFKSRKYFDKTAFILILAGAISNMIDRIARGCVVDFIDINFWPVFNLADIYITIGVAMLILNTIKSKCREANP
ncbi:MAG: Lipoprotein signal peptidase [Candidatus Moranbacteria bacterium GW2011_GWC1_45_18]|nr:MAG: Lipoprotein signal peptidase [Candidatus Moranbacteria bacterium GW2011_GWC2_40_12]KKT32622.1 MAG: Lipoprotein signal peptidase [Candidatus Moranbacteria bacterium GW2011_GWF2_44_10]KKU00743.1 MAG: Lipoprotein signal peptidase [Candidatus Moranbacteria bacterium GW2011_GWC1_45_18]OGI24202.1 MAG: signal peptidase II [Candidatus Moranbacteria bacterium RIFOXYA1_FULL_44_8]OGI35256.1 MAG: signal peptidase II [Candidatus Moranbacteria bacterium RIFOXYC1_FULL_44_8]OGI39942.1 MAG: signal pept